MAESGNSISVFSDTEESEEDEDYDKLICFPFKSG